MHSKPKTDHLGSSNLLPSDTSGPSKLGRRIGKVSKFFGGQTMKTGWLLILMAAATVMAQDDYYYYDEDYEDAGEGSSRSQRYKGKFVGVLTTNHHQVSGKLYVVDDKTLLLKDFTYDGQGRDAFFMGGGDGSPSPNGFIIPNKDYKTNVLRRYLNEEFTLTLRPGKTVTDMHWFSVFDIETRTSFGEVFFVNNFEPPTPQHLLPLEGFSNQVKAEEVIIIDTKTILLNNFFYDGRGGDGVHFWAGIGPQPSDRGYLVPNENGYLEPLGRYGRLNGKHVRLMLPGNLTVFDIRWFSVYDTKNKRNMGHVFLPSPDNINVPPALVDVIDKAMDTQLPNCEMLHANLRIAWSVFAPTITLELAGNIDPQYNEYLAFGVANPQGQSKMIGSDVSVAYIDGFQAVVDDYNITAKSLCTSILQQNSGVCPDIHSGGTQNTQLQSFVQEDGYFEVTYRRDLINSQDPGDNSFAKEGPTSVVWAIGHLASGTLSGKSVKGRPKKISEEPSYHHTYPRTHVQIDFNRKKAANNCWAFVKNTRAIKQRTLHPEIKDAKDEYPSYKKELTPWKRKRFWSQNVRKYSARLGPSGGFSRGYSALSKFPTTGKVWYVNGFMTPELYLQRGLSYTWTVEGGNNPTSPEFYHPLVITNDDYGGYWRMPQDGSRRDKVKIYAGVKYTFRGVPQPTAAGRLCLWKHQNGSDPRQDDIYDNFARYRNSLTLDCDKQGEGATITFSPNASWPDVVYYQSFISPYMGGRINVVDDLSSIDRSTVFGSDACMILPAFTLILASLLSYLIH